MIIIVGEKVQLSLVKSYNYKIDYFVINSLIYLFVTLPIAVEGFNPYLMTINKVLILLIAFLAGYKFYIINSNRIKLSIVSGYFIIFVIYSYFSGIYLYEINYFNGVKELLLFVSLVFIIWFVKNTPIKIQYIKFISFIILLYSVDVIIQAKFGIDLFGFINHFNERFWGIFHYGAPSFGIFIALFIFLPFFLYKNLFIKISIFSIYLYSLILSNDRAAILIVLFSLFMYMFIKNRKYFILSSMILFVLSIFIFQFKELLPYRIEMLINLINKVIEEGIFLDDNALKESSVYHYLEIWSTNLNIWFSLDNYFFILFGSGWGNLQAFFITYGGFERTHNMLLEILMTFGIVGSLVFILIIKRLLIYNDNRLLLIFTYFTPFLFFSLFSANQLLLFVVSYMIYMNLNYRKDCNAK